MGDSINPPAIEAYALSMTTPESPLLSEIREHTQNMHGSQMLSGRVVGQLLAMLVRITHAKVVFEVGTFSGYSALSMAEALSSDGRLYTCEINPESFELAKRFFQKSAVSNKIIPLLGPAMGFIKQCDKTIDLVFIDADKKMTQAYFEALLPKVRQGGIIVVDNVLWKGKVLLAQPDKTTEALQAFNQFIVQDSRVESVLLPVRDGLNIIRKK